MSIAYINTSICESHLSQLLNAKFDLLQCDSITPLSTNLPSIIRHHIQHKISKNKRLNFLPRPTIRQLSGSQTERTSFKHNSVISRSPQLLSHGFYSPNYFPTRTSSHSAYCVPLSCMHCTVCVCWGVPLVTCGSALVFFGRTRHMSQMRGRKGGGCRLWCPSGRERTVGGSTAGNALLRSTSATRPTVYSPFSGR